MIKITLLILGSLVAVAAGIGIWFIPFQLSGISYLNNVVVRVGVRLLADIVALSIFSYYVKALTQELMRTTRD